MKTTDSDISHASWMAFTIDRLQGELNRAYASGYKAGLLEAAEQCLLLEEELSKATGLGAARRRLEKLANQAKENDT